MKAPFLGQTVSNTEEAFSPDSKKTASPIPGDDLENPIYTGRYFIVPDNGETSLREAVNSFGATMGLSVASSSDYDLESFSEENIADADIYLYEKHGVALVSIDQEQVEMMTTVLSSHPVRIEPELVMYAIPFESTTFVEGSTVAAGPVSVTAAACTWGIHATGSDISKFTGKNVKVAILDTGLDLRHPDFAGRVPAANQHSLVPGISTVQDLHGHGTHCTGTACGRKDVSGTRYGVAGDSEIYIGKVLDNSGRGAQAWIMDGIDWAVSQNCKVISLSLGSRAFPGISFDTAYERTAAHAVANGALIVAAAGNDSRRPGRIEPVGSPANCPSVLAVAAINSSLDIAFFSNGSLTPGQDVYIAGPGVDVHSSWPMPTRYKTISGTSMATPHLAGIAALIWEQNPTFTPSQVKTELRNLAKSLAPLLPTDIGCGLGTAP